MRSTRNALVWLGLIVGLPGLLFAMCKTPNEEVDRAFPHDPAICKVCRHENLQGASVGPISDPDVIIVAQAHQK
jgi:hypothetical protein